MKDEDKTKEQLIKELRELRRQVATLEVSLHIKDPIDAIKKTSEETAEDAKGEDYWAMFEQIPVGVYRTTPDDKIIRANQALADMLGYENVEDLQKVYVSELYVDIEDRFNHLQKLLNSTTYFTEFQLRRKNGQIIWVRDYPRAIVGSDGKIAYFDGVLVDITERKRIEMILTSRVII